LTSPRAGGAWGIAFVVVLFISAAMVSLPTASNRGDEVRAFFSAHRSIIVLQQLIGAAALVPLFFFVLSIKKQWVVASALFIAAAELATNLVPLIIVITNPGADGAHTLTQIEDLADAALFVGIALFLDFASRGEIYWLRWIAVAAAAICLMRAIVSPLEIHYLDAIAPLAFILVVILLSLRMLIRKPA
jgi:hypothetical protein